MTEFFKEHSSIENQSNHFEIKWIPSSKSLKLFTSPGSRFISVGCSEENNQKGQIQIYKLNSAEEVSKFLLILSDYKIKIHKIRITD
jgi:hypothetical protein